MVIYNLNGNILTILSNFDRILFCAFHDIAPKTTLLSMFVYHSELAACGVYSEI